MVETQKFAGDNKRPQGTDGALQVGAVLNNRYKITGVLGVGGMGSVYLARDMNFPTVTRNVAVKEMLNLATDPQLREVTVRNFEREANILADLNHPAIPKIYDYFSSRDRAYLVMEYINGKDLEAIVNSVQDFLPYPMVKKWTLELCDVLSYLHTRGEPIIFRDMKPSNVMIDAYGLVRLIDFGIAKAFQSDQKKGTQIGTEGYSPPEQYKGEATPAGDIYALGATIHHILTRRDPRLEPPFSFMERMVRDINPNVPEGFAKIITQALAYNPLERFTNATEMKAAIEELDKISAPSVQTGARTQFISGTTTFDNEVSKGGVQAVWKFRVEDELRSSPVHYKGMLYVTAYDNNLYALNAADGAFKWKFPTENGISTTPGIAPDENLIIFGSEDGNLYAVDLRTGKVQWTHRTDGPIRGSVAIEHGHIFFGSDDAKLYAIRLMNGRLAWKYEGAGAIRSRPAVTDDRIVFGIESGEVIGLDLSGALKWKFKAKRAVTASPLIHDQIAYVGSMDAHIYAIDVQTGWGIWRVRTQNAVLSTPAINGRALYVGSADGYMYALDVAANGRELWKYKTDGQVIGSPVVADNQIYFGGIDTYIYSLEPKKGNLRWKYQTNGAITASPCIVGNMLYIGSTDKHVYALNV